MQQTFLGKSWLLKMSKVNIADGRAFDCTKVVYVTNLSHRFRLPVRSSTQLCYGIYRKHLENGDLETGWFIMASVFLDHLVTVIGFISYNQKYKLTFHGFVIANISV
jgi:hypothetical protein